MATHTAIPSTTLIRSANTAHATTGDGVTLRIRVSNADVGAAFMLLDVTVPPYWDACAPHWHAHTTEVIYVLNSTLACTLDDTTTTASGGTILLIPPNVVHTIWNPTATPATYLAWFVPASAARHGAAGSPPAASALVHAPAPQLMLATLSAINDVLFACPDQGDGRHPDE